MQQQPTGDDGCVKVATATAHVTADLRLFGMPTADRAIAGSVFRPGGAPSPADVRQGGLADCYLLAALMSVARRHPQALRDALHNVDTHTFRIGLFDREGGQRQWVTLGKSELVFCGCFPVSVSRWLIRGGPCWPLAFEKGFAQRFGGYDAIGGAVRSKTAKDAFEALFGVEAHEIPVPASAKEDRQRGFVFPWRSRRRGLALEALACFAGERWSAVEADVSRWIDYVHRAQIERPLWQDGRYVAPTREFFTRHIKRAGIRGEARSLLLSYYARFAQGKAHDGGDYLSPARRFHDELRALLDRGACLTIRTEAPKRGRPSRHVFTRHGTLTTSPAHIILAHEYEVVGVHCDAAGRRFVRLRDPRGGGLLRRAERDVELSKVLRVCAAVTHCTPARNATRDPLTSIQKAHLGTPYG